MDKQIEEMAKVINNPMLNYCRELNKCKEACLYSGKSCRHYTCRDYAYAERLYNAGYRKIHEGAVVLMGMETEQRFEDLMVTFDEMGFMPYTTHPFPEEYVETWKQRLIFVFGQLRKETVDKFAELFRENSMYSHKDGFDYYVIYTDEFDEICKEITEGK